MKKILLGLIVCVALCGVAAAEQEWLTDASQAQGLAQKENKLVMLDFTGSDWCIWCKKLHNEVFSTSEFQDYANKNLVLVTVDFPRQKKLSEEQTKANKELAQKYNIKGYPTVIVLNGDGKKVGELSYSDGMTAEDTKEFQTNHKEPKAKPATFIAALDKVKEKAK